MSARFVGRLIQRELISQITKRHIKRTRYSNARILVVRRLTRLSSAFLSMRGLMYACCLILTEYLYREMPSPSLALMQIAANDSMRRET